MWGVTEETTRPLGEWLRQRREELGIGLEQAEADTRIRARYLEALEAEDLDALPDLIVGRGFLRNYANYLGLSAEEAAARLAQFGAPPLPEPLPAEDAQPFGSEPFRPVALHDMPGFRSSRGWIFGLAGWVLSLIAGIIAIREAMEFETGNAVITVVISWIAAFVLAMIINGLFGLGLAMSSGLFG